MRVDNYLSLSHPIHLHFHNQSNASYHNLHSHEGIEFLYIHKGTGQVVIEQHLYEVSPGTLFVFRPFELHHVAMEGSDTHPYVRSVFNFRPTVIEQYIGTFPALQSFFLNIWNGKSEDRVLTDLPKCEVNAFFEIHKQRFTATESKEEIHEYALFIIAFLHYIRFYWEQQNVTQTKGVRGDYSPVEQIVQWIYDNYKEDFSLKMLASLVHLSPNHVSSLFHKTTGSTISEYLIARRLQQACQLLITSTRSIQQVGEEVGLSNCSYFCKVFRKNIGMSPRQFRKSNGYADD